MASRPAWKLTEAVERTGASRSTLRRYLAAGKFPNAYKDSSNAWRFPLEDLLAVGLSPSQPARERALSASSEQGQSMSTEQASAASAEQVSKLEQALREERVRADNAERLAASYLANAEDLRRALRMLEAGTRQPEQSSEPTQNMVSEQPGNKPEQSTMNQPEPAPLRLWRRLSNTLR
jgi:predicted DNA-binding transcriptional regulator AlpA